MNHIDNITFLRNIAKQILVNLADVCEAFDGQIIIKSEHKLINDKVTLCVLVYDDQIINAYIQLIEVNWPKEQIDKKINIDNQIDANLENDKPAHPKHAQFNRLIIK